jgi:hypothetical protein
VLKWARELRCEWYGTTCAYAALGGHLEVLRWAHEHGCPWDYKTSTAANNGGWALHSFTSELKLSNSRTHACLKLGYTVIRSAQVELQWERV